MLEQGDSQPAFLAGALGQAETERENIFGLDTFFFFMRIPAGFQKPLSELAGISAAYAGNL